MTRGKVLGLIVVAGLAGGYGAAMWARADGPPTRTPRIGNFVLVHDRVSNSVIPMEKVELLPIGGKQFLIGTGVRVSAFKTVGVGRPVWINLEDANTIIHFDTLSEMDKALIDGQPPRDH
jgi:hypothetical protein